MTGSIGICKCGSDDTCDATVANNCKKIFAIFNSGNSGICKCGIHNFCSDSSDNCK